jgi:hypothetical protein
MAQHVAATAPLSGHQNLRLGHQESVDRTRLALRVHLVVTAVQFGIQNAAAIQLQSFAVTVRLTGHLDQLLHLNATMGQMVTVATELTDLSPMINVIAVPHVLISLLVSLRQDHGTQVVHKDRTASHLHSPSVRKPAGTLTEGELRFRPAGLTGMNVRGRHALPSLSVQEHPELQIAG